MPPYTTSSAGFSATSGSRLFISMRSGASVIQERAESFDPRAARITRGLTGASMMYLNLWDSGAKSPGQFVTRSGMKQLGDRRDRSRRPGAPDHQQAGLIVRHRE